MGQLLSINSLLSRLQIGRTTLHRLRKNAGFPEPALVRGKMQRWSVDDVEAWIQAQKKETPKAA